MRFVRKIFSDFIGIIKVCGIHTALKWIIFILFVLVGVVFQFLFYLMVPATIIYLKYYSKPKFKELKILFLYMVAFIPALLLSTLLSTIILNLAGMHVYFVFTF